MKSWFSRRITNLCAKLLFRAQKHKDLSHSFLYFFVKPISVLLCCFLFFSFPSYALAAEEDIDSLALEPDDFLGDFSLSLSNNFFVANQSSLSLDNGSYTATYVADVTVRAGLSGLKPGYSYYGSVGNYVILSYTPSSLISSYRVFCSAYGDSTPDNVTTYTTFQSASNPSVYDNSLGISAQFFYFVPVRTTFYFDVYMHVYVTLQSTSVPPAYVRLNVSYASDFSSSLKFVLPTNTDSVLGGLYDVNDTLQSQMQQQESIAAAQESAAQARQDQLVNGYDSAANDSMLADRGSQLGAYEAQQDSAFQMGQGFITDFSSNYSTSAFTAMSPSFILISDWFNQIWAGMGSFTVLLSVGLVLCVAGYILKLRK